MFYVKVCGTWQAIGRKREALSDQKRSLPQGGCSRQAARAGGPSAVIGHAPRENYLNDHRTVY